MKPFDMDDAAPELTEAERRAIAEIRRKLDDEFQRKLDSELGATRDSDAAADTGEMPRGRGSRLEAATARRLPRRGVVASLLVGTAAVLGVAAMLWVGHADRNRPVVSDARVPMQDVQPSDDAGAPAPLRTVPVNDVALLHDAVETWIDATRRGDIPAQMRYYPRHVPVYYTWRDVPREAVRAEKVKVFGAASRLLITTDALVVELAPDRQTAVTRFRKGYVIEGPVIRRRGEVLQELRWARTTDGWQIIGERDARVLRTS